MRILIASSTLSQYMHIVLASVAAADIWLIVKQICLLIRSRQGRVDKEQTIYTHARTHVYAYIRTHLSPADCPIHLSSRQAILLKAFW
jgi:hypothetical protein